MSGGRGGGDGLGMKVEVVKLCFGVLVREAKTRVLPSWCCHLLASLLLKNAPYLLPHKEVFNTGFEEE